MARVLLSVILAFVPTTLHAQTAAEIVGRVDQLLRGQSSRGTIRMEIVTEHWDRALEMESWSLGTEYSLVRILSPQKDAGTATLKAGNEIWNYLPRVDRTIKLPASLMGASWMGSHFTNDDLVKDSRVIEDFDIEISFEGSRNGANVWEFTLVPKPDAAVVWGKIVEEVRKSDLMPLWVNYYDDQGELARQMVFSDFQMMGGRMVPARMVITPFDKPNESTTIIYVDLAFDIGE